VIANLSGTILEKQLQRLTIDVGGVGYDVHVSLSTMYTLGEVGSKVSLRIHTYLSTQNDVLRLFGFATATEHQLFEQLVSVSGIGAKLGLAILSGIEPSELIKAIRNNDLARITAIPGLGRKKAELLVLQLKDRLKRLAADPADIARTPGDDLREDLLSALANLGYQRAAAEKAVDRALGKVESRELEPLLREVLKGLVR
jgi:Holliday junction DNA helicase RuvA